MSTNYLRCMIALTSILSLPGEIRFYWADWESLKWMMLSHTQGPVKSMIELFSTLCTARSLVVYISFHPVPTAKSFVRLADWVPQVFRSWGGLWAFWVCASIICGSLLGSIAEHAVGLILAWGRASSKQRVHKGHCSSRIKEKGCLLSWISTIPSNTHSYAVYYTLPWQFVKG